MESERNYQSLRDYLAKRDGHLSLALLPRPERNSMSGRELEVEINRWVMELGNKETLRKFIELHLATCHLRNRFRENVNLNMSDFQRRIMDICDTDDRKIRENARRVNRW